MSAPRAINLAEYQFSPEAFELLLNIMRSCGTLNTKPEFSREQVRASDFYKLTSAYAVISVVGYCQKIGVKEIGFDEVAMAFATENHADPVWEKAGNKFQEEDKRVKYFFSHILCPLSVTSVKNGKIEGQYSNNGLSVILKNVKSDLKTLKRDLVLVHMGQVISKCPSELWKKISESQAKNDLINKVFGKVKEIDYSSFLSLHLSSK